MLFVVVGICFTLNPLLAYSHSKASSCRTEKERLRERVKVTLANGCVSWREGG
jgi:hypothetical protein